VVRIRMPLGLPQGSRQPGRPARRRAPKFGRRARFDACQPSPAERQLMDFTAPKTAQTNGITMEYFEEGEGTPVLLLHGFPEHPFSWRMQVPAVVEAGFRAIVPSQRGYAGTDAPADAQTYSVKNLVVDLTGL